MRHFVWPLVAAVLAAGCSRESSMPADSGPEVGIRTRITDRLGAPVRIRDRLFVREDSLIELWFRWEVPNPERPLPEGLLVLVQLTDEAGETVLVDEHFPPVPTERWLSDGPIEYTRVLAIPAGLPSPAIKIWLALCDPGDHEQRWPLRLMDQGGTVVRRHLVADLRVQPADEPVYDDGWGVLESPPEGGPGWRWLLGSGRYAMVNPHGQIRMRLQGDAPIQCFETPPRVEVVGAGGLPVTSFEVTGRFDVAFPVSRQQLGSEEWSQFTIRSSATFVPAECGLSIDTRKLALRFEEITTWGVEYGEGWYAPETGSGRALRWMKGRSLTRVGNPAVASVLFVRAFLPRSRFEVVPRLTIRVSGQQVEEIEPAADELALAIPVTAEQLGSAPEAEIELVMNAVFIPRDSGLSDDPRELGLLLKDLKLVPQE